MTSSEMAVLIILMGAIGGAWGARLSGADAWRGIVVVAVSAVATLTLLAVIGVANQLLAIVAYVIFAAAVGGVLKLRARQTASVLLGGVLAAVMAGSIAGYVARL